jgi:molybdate-binding protein
MKMRASRIERMLAKIEATLVPPERKWLRAIIHGNDEAEAKEKALAEHIAAHPEDAGLTVRDFNWVLRVIVRPVVRPAA